MLGNFDCIPSILLSMVNTKYGANLVASEGPVGFSIGLFYGKKLQTRQETKSNSRRKLFPEDRKRPSVMKQKNDSNFVRKKVIFKTNSPSKCIIQDKLTKRRGVYNGKSAETVKNSGRADHKAEKFEPRKTIPQNQKSENIYQKVYKQNLRKIRNCTEDNFQSHNVSYKISNVRIDIIKHKLSPDQLRGLNLSGYSKQRRLANTRKKCGIPVLLMPEGSFRILDCVVKGKVSRIPHSLRYIKPSHTADNYGLGNQQDIEFDDEDCPRKVIPRWAQGELLEQALVEQEEVDISNMIFSVCESPNLDLMFPQAASKRDIWRTPPSSYSSRFGHRVEEVQGGPKEDLIRFVTERLVNKDCQP